MALESDTLVELCMTLRRFVAEQMIPAEAKVCEDRCNPGRMVAEMRALGLFGLTTPEEYGGLGLSMEEEVTVCSSSADARQRSARSSAPMSASAGRALRLMARRNRRINICRVWHTVS